MTNEAERISNVQSQGALAWHRITSKRFKTEDIIHDWEAHKMEEAKVVAQATTPSAATIIGKNYHRTRMAFWAANRDYMAAHFELTDEGLLRLKEASSKPVAPALVVAAPVAQTPSVKLPKETAKNNGVEAKKLSPTEKAIFLFGVKAPEAEKVLSAPPVRAEKDADPLVQKDPLLRQIIEVALQEEEERKRAADLTSDSAWQQIVEQTYQEEQERIEFTRWLGQRTVEELEKLVVPSPKTGEAVWTGAVTVETYSPNHRFILFRSSTAPLLGNRGPIVKHDFRANGIPVTINHPQMLRMKDEKTGKMNRVIRSKVLNGKEHEYYCKAMEYQEGMYIKGYFTVNGAERHDLTRYFVCRNGAVHSISEVEYRKLENGI